MGTRTVTGIIYHLDGTPWAAGEIKFTLIEAFETSTETYPRETHTETLDTNGEFSITLGVPDSGTAHYQVETPDKKAYDFFLAAGAATTLETILLIAGSPVSQDAVQTIIDAHVVRKDVHYIPRHDSLVIAADDAYSDNKYQADHLCDGSNDDDDINNAIADLSHGGSIKLSDGNFVFGSSVILRKGVSICGILPGTTTTHVATWDSDFTVSGGTIITYPGGTVFTQDMTAGLGTLTALDGIIIENLGFNNVASIITSGELNKTGLCGSIIRNILASNITGIAFDLTNMMHIHMSMIKASFVYQFLRLTSNYDSAVINNQPGNSYFDDLYAYVTAAGHAQPTIHLRALNENNHGTHLNFCTFTRIQVNRFLSADKTGNHLFLEGNPEAYINYCSFNDCDFEGAADYRIKMSYASKCRIFLLGNVNVPTDVNEDFYMRNSTFNHITSYTNYAVLDADSTCWPLFFNGSMKAIPGEGKYPIGFWYDQNTTMPRLGLDKYGVNTIVSKGNGDDLDMPIIYMDFSSGGGVRQPVTNWNADWIMPIYLLGYVNLTLSGNQAITLPDATLCKGQCTTFKKTGATGTVTFDGHDGQHIDGADTNTWLDTQYKYITLQSDGANWLIVAKG